VTTTAAVSILRGWLTSPEHQATQAEPRHLAKEPHVSDRSAIVVGGGIMGSSTARALVHDGWDVTLLEQGPLPNPHASSGGVHRLIRSTYGAMQGYTNLVVDGYAAWGRLWDDLGQTLMTHTGMLAVDTAASSFGADSADCLDALGLPYERLDADAVRARYPQFVVPDGATSIYTNDGHFLRAGAIVAALAGWLRDAGANVHEHTPVRDVDLDAGTVVTADNRTRSADLVIVAAGPWTNRLVPELEADLTPSRQVVLDVVPPPHLAEAWSRGPAFLLPPMYGIPPRDELPLKISDHAFSMTGDPADDRTPQASQIREILEVAGEALVDIDQYELLEARTCFYTVRDEERFLVAPRGDRGVVLGGFSGHGFKFGALIGEMVAMAIADPSSWPAITARTAGR
jgi:glycine/D-amino acid oxidase-like deaminating enzyme